MVAEWGCWCRVRRCATPGHAETLAWWAAPVVAGRTDVGAGQHECGGCIRATAHRRPHERSVPAANKSSLQVRTRDRIAHGRCIQHTGLPVVVLGIEGGAAGDEHIDCTRVAMHRRSNERSPPEAW